jgi:hypothetical protein
MKKSVSLLAVLMVMSTMIFARRLDTPAAVAASGMAVMKTGSIFKVFYKGNKENTVKVTILNSDKEIVYKEIVKNTAGFARPYNFVNLPEGDYSIEVNDETGTRIERVSYHTGSVQKLAHLSRLNGDTERFILTVSNKDSENLEIKIYNEDQTLIYSGSEKIKGDFAKIYNLEKITGKVSFEISDDKGVTKTLRY